MTFLFSVYVLVMLESADMQKSLVADSTLMRILSSVGALVLLETMDMQKSLVADSTFMRFTYCVCTTMCF